MISRNRYLPRSSVLTSPLGTIQENKMKTKLPRFSAW